MTAAPARAATPAWSVRDWWQCAAVCMLVALAVHAVTFVTEGVGSRADIAAHVRWAHQFSLALAEGQWVPRWLGLANGGLGEPTFVALHPGYYYVIAALQAAGLELWAAMRAAAFGATFLLGMATCWVLRPYLAPRQAQAGAALMQSLPFIVFLFTLYEALPWHLSFPLVVLAIGLSLQGGPGARWFDARLAIVIALTTLVHLMVAFMLLLCLGAVQLGRWVHRRGWRSAWRDPFVGWALAVALGLGLSAYYWLLAGTSQPLFRHWMDVAGLYRSSFVLPFVTSQLHGMRWPAIQWILPLPSVAIVVAAIVLLRRAGIAWAPGTREAAWQLVLVALAGLFMSSELAYPLYAGLGSLQSVQFPYRFLTLSDVAATLAFAIALQPGLARRPRLAVGMATGAVVLTIGLCAVFLAKQAREGARPDVAALLEGDLGTAYSQPSTLGPRWKQYLADGGFAGHCARVQIRCEEGVRKGHHRTWRLQAAQATEVLLPLFAFPAWRVSIDGTEVQTGIDAATGVIRMRLPPGTHEIDVRWTDLWQERVGKWISWTSLGVLGLVALAGLGRKRPIGASARAA